jgi:opacity protein-like surface antigen
MADEMKHAFPAYQSPGAHYDWTGLHVGMHVDDNASHTGSSAIDTVTGTAVAPGDLSPTDWHYGVQVGYDYMFPSRVVLGFEGDVDSGWRKATYVTDATGTASIESNVFDSETVRLRLGYAIYNILLYGTGGLAWSSNQYIRTQLSGTVNNSTPGQDEALNKYLGGWTWGGGVAIAFAKDWNAFAEYRHTSYDTATFPLPLSQIVTTSKSDLSEIEFGVNYKFDLTAPPSNSFSGGVGGAGASRSASFYKAPLFKARPRTAEAYDWTGVYGGIDGGYGWADSSGVLTDALQNPLDPYDIGTRSPFAGVFVGGNYQFNYFVVGAEADFQWGNLFANNQANSGFFPPDVTMPVGTFPGGPFTITTTIKEFGSVRGRVGLAFDRFLIYGTAGWAWGDPTTGYALLGAPPFPTNPANGGNSYGLTSGGNSSSGWTAGGGLDYAFTKNVFGRIEYRYTDLGTTSFLNLATNSGESGNKVTISDLRAGIAYKFGGGPVLAKF